MKEFQERIGSLNMGCIIMNPQNGEIYAMSSYPEYDLNDPWPCLPQSHKDNNARSARQM